MNGYSYNGGYNGTAMAQGDQRRGSDGMMMMMMGQDAMGSGMVGGQSLDEIVNQNTKAMRRQSVPHHFGGSPNDMGPDMRRISMMDFGSGSPASPEGNFQYDPHAAMNQSSMMSGNGTPAQNQRQRSHSRRQSHTELALNTNFANTSQSYNSMMNSNSAYQSPAHPQSGFDMAMERPYIDPGINMQMEYNVEQNLGNVTGGEMSQMNVYNQPQFNQSMMSSPMHASGSQSTAHAAQGPSQDPGGSSGMNPQYSGHTNSSRDTLRHISRRQSLQMPSMSSPVHSGGLTPMSQPASAGPQNNANAGFQAQPQHPQSGSQQDRGLHNVASTYDGVNGPLPVNAANYNPNNQGYAWEAPEGGWPSTMVGKPHMETSNKNAYSSTGFDMLGVLVR